MVKSLILSHGELARRLLDTARRIACDTADVSALCLEWDDTLEEHRARLGSVIDGLEAGQQMLILTDMFGGTPHNVASGFHDPGRVEILAGVNLPMVVRLCCLEEPAQSAAELLLWIQKKGKRSICANGITPKGETAALSHAERAGD